MTGHAIKAGNQLTPSSSRFYLVHFSGKFLLDTLPEPDMVRSINHVPQKVNALAHREHPLIWLYGKPDRVYPLMDGITNLPQFRFRFTKYHTVITIAVVMTDTVPVLQIMV